jgi:hypothetical protein
MARFPEAPNLRDPVMRELSILGAVLQNAAIAAYRTHQN